jgi:hypothetical protein
MSEIKEVDLQEVDYTPVIESDGLNKDIPGVTVPQNSGVQSTATQTEYMIGDKDSYIKFDGNTKQIYSSNYQTGTTGWTIKADGDVEFNDGTFRGDVAVSSLHIPDQTTSSSLHINTSGKLWAGANVAAVLTAPLVINPTGLMTLGDVNNPYLVLDGPNAVIKSSDYVADASGFLVSTSLVEAENIRARGLMKGVTFQYDAISAIGGQLMVANADTLASDMTAQDSSTITVVGSTTFSANDILLIRAVATSGIEEEWFRVVSSAGTTYTVTRDLAGSFSANNNPVWKAGTTIVKMGVSDGGSTYSGGWLKLLGQGTNSPYYSVIARTGVAYNAYSEVCRLGNLNGINGFSADAYGIFAGNASTGNYMQYDTTSGELKINDSVISNQDIMVMELTEILLFLLTQLFQQIFTQIIIQ